MMTQSWWRLSCWLVGFFTSIGSGHQSGDTWVVIVATSRYWFNYRHTANAALIYKAVTTLGVSDDHIILMNALDISNNARNANEGSIYFDGLYHEELWPSTEFEVDYTEEETSRQTFLNVLTDRTYAEYLSRNRLYSDENSTVLIYMTGHGGDEFFKFHDSEELSAQDLALALNEMYTNRRYKEILLVLDTCQAVTMANYITAPNVITLASSVKGENSYAYPTVDSLGVATADRFTHSLYTYLTSNMVHTKATVATRPRLRSGLSLQHLQASFDRRVLYSTATIVLSPHSRDPKVILLEDYFSGLSGATNADVLLQEVTQLSTAQDAVARYEAQRRKNIVDNLLFV